MAGKPPRRETMAFAAKAAARPKSYASFLGVPVEEELMLTREMARRLFALLSVRHPSLLDQIVSEWETDARATVDREFEAALILFERHRIDVVPARKILWDQDQKPCQFIITRPSGETEIVLSDKLLMMAGLEA